MFFASIAVASLALPLLTAAQLVPTGPSPGQVFKEGAACTITWNADPSGKWKTTFIELMTGPNNPMVHLATVAQVDGTDPTKASFSMPCPSVTPNSAIYFYQFTAAGQSTTWTGRFAISDGSGNTTPPPNGTQPDGSNIPWGLGQFVNAGAGSPPPPTAPSGQIDGSNSTPNNSLPPPVLTASVPISPASIPPTAAASAGPPSASVSAPPSASTPPSAPAPSTPGSTQGSPPGPGSGPSPASSPSGSSPGTTTVVVPAADSSPSNSSSPPSPNSAPAASFPTSTVLVVAAAILSLAALQI
ncbi:hypothetical protein K439DRAFT_1343454 [Ramaria rubella]|nr:hypothetical protein K439DRAFT_1343454 [Ramaria rubella]